MQNYSLSRLMFSYRLISNVSKYSKLINHLVVDDHLLLNSINLIRSNNYKQFYNSKAGVNLPLMTLYTKNECSLCDELVDELEPYMHRVNYII